jgi:purine-nucleoside phosphorylase
MITKESHSLAQLLSQKRVAVPSIHIVLGSGLAPAFESTPPPAGFKLVSEIAFSEVPGLLPSSAPGHKGCFKIFEDSKTQKTFSFQVGRLHGYEGHDPVEVVQPLVQMALAGTPKFLLTNASGSLNPFFLPGSLMIIDDQFNFTGKNPLYGPNSKKENGEFYGPRFTDMSACYNEELNSLLSKTLVEKGLSVHRGTYIGVNGPTFETPAEVKLFSQWGLGAVGMSTVWECIALNYLGKTVAGASFISNMGCGLVSKQALSHAEVEAEAAKSAPVLLAALFDFAQRSL